MVLAAVAGADLEGDVAKPYLLEQALGLGIDVDALLRRLERGDFGHVLWVRWEKSK